MTSNLGTKTYKAPEIDETKPQYTQKVDVYSLGLILFWLFHKKPPKREKGEVEEMAKKYP